MFEEGNTYWILVYCTTVVGCVLFYLRAFLYTPFQSQEVAVSTSILTQGTRGLLDNRLELVSRCIYILNTENNLFFYVCY